MEHKDMEELRKHFLKIEKRRWKEKKKDNQLEYSQDSYYLGGIFTCIKSLGLEKEFGIRRAGPYFKEGG